MKTFLVALVCALSITSCNKYQINLLSSSNIAKDQLTGRFKMENDSVKITYSFLGSNTVMQVDILNKLNQPLYVDWKRSSLIVNGKSYTYADNMIHFNGNVSSTTISSKNLAISDGSIDVAATLPKNISFIPPHTQISSGLANVANYSFDDINDIKFAKIQLPLDGDSGQFIIAKAANFNINSSPIKFANYLTLYTLSNSIPQFINIQHDFYVSRIIKSLVNPESLQFAHDVRSDFYYTSQKTTYGKIATGTIVGASVVGAAAVDASQNKKDQ
jgi:hypothetical protein